MDVQQERHSLEERSSKLRAFVAKQNEKLNGIFNIKVYSTFLCCTFARKNNFDRVDLCFTRVQLNFHEQNSGIS